MRNQQGQYYFHLTCVEPHIRNKDSPLTFLSCPEGIGLLTAVVFLEQAHLMCMSWLIQSTRLRLKTHFTFLHVRKHSPLPLPLITFSLSVDPSGEGMPFFCCLCIQALAVLLSLLLFCSFWVFNITLTHTLCWWLLCSLIILQIFRASLNLTCVLYC